MKDFSDNEQELDDHTIIIKDIKQKFSKEDIRRIFKDCGEIRKIVLTKKENKFCDAKIVFDEKDSVLIAVKKNQEELQNFAFFITRRINKNHKEEIDDNNQNKKNKIKFIIPNQTKLNFFEDKINNFNLELDITNEKFKIDHQSNKKLNSNKYSDQQKDNPFSEEDESSCYSSSNKDSENENTYDENHYNEFIKEYKIFFNNKNKSLKSNNSNLNNTNNSEVDFLMNKANSLYLSYNLDEAIKVLHEIIRLNPNIQEVYSLLSLIYEEKKDFKNSIYFLMIAAHLSQGDFEIWIKCFNQNKILNNLQQAEFCISRAVKVEKENPYFLYEKAIINEELNNFKKAANTYKKLLDITDSNSEILIHTANIYEKVLHSNEKAINILKTHIFNTTKKPLILNKLFNLYLESSKYDEIVNFYETNKNTDDATLKKCFDNIITKLFLNLAYMGRIKCHFINNIEERNNYLKETFNCIKILIDVNFKIGDEIDNYGKKGKGKRENDDKIKNQFVIIFNKLFEMFCEKNDLEIFIKFFEELEIKLYSEVKEKYFDHLFTEGKFDNLNDHSENYELELRVENFVILSEYFLLRKNYDKSIEYLNRALYFTKKIKGDSVYLILKISHILNLKGDYGNSLEILNKTNKNNSNKSKENNITGGQIDEILNTTQNLNNTIRTKKEINIEDKFIDNEKNGFYHNLNLEKLNSLDFPFDDYREEEENRGKHFLENLIFNEDLNRQLINEMEIDKDNNHTKFYDEKLNNCSLQNNENYNEFNNIIYDNFKNLSFKGKEEKNKGKILGRKRIRLSNKSAKLRNKNIDNINFDNFLKLKKKFEPEKNKTIDDFKKEYESLALEINSNRQLYVNLQEALIYLKNDQKQKFYTTSYESLKKILLQEIMISNYKTRLLYKLLLTNNLNSTKSTSDFSDENRDEKVFHNQDENENKMDWYKAKEDLNFLFGGYESIKEHLFLPKSKLNNSQFNRKKIRKSFDQVEKLMKNIDYSGKYIDSKNLKMIVYYFISVAFQNKKYNECNEILKLVLSNELFNKKKDAFIFNLHIFAILTNFYIENYRISYQFMKKIILNFDLIDNYQFWVYFSTIANKLKLSTVRTSLYKLSKNKLLSKNIYLNSILSNCYLKTGNYNLSVKFLNKLKEESSYKDPICYFIMALNYTFNSMSRKNKFKEETFLKGSNFMNIYQFIRNRENPLEVLFNLGRFNQFIGHDREALKYYDLFCNKIGNCMMNEFGKEKIQNSMLYNYAILLKKSGNEIEAHKTILDNIII